MSELEDFLRDHHNPIVSQLNAEIERLKLINQAMRQNFLAWVDSRIESEVTHRPDVNIYKRTLHETWSQVRIYAIEMENGATVIEPSLERRL